MKKEDIKVVKITNNNVVGEIKNALLTGFNKFKGDGFLITNRKAGFGFLESFADSLYMYDKGIFLLERFYKRDKCKYDNIVVRSVQEKDCDLINEFKSFSDKIPEVSELSEDEIKEYNDKINKYKEKIGSVKLDETAYKAYKYGHTELVEFDLLTENDLKGMADIDAFFAISCLTFITFGYDTDKVSLAVTCIEHDDFYDIVLLPVRDYIKKDED